MAAEQAALQEELTALQELAAEDLQRDDSEQAVRHYRAALMKLGALEMLSVRRHLSRQGVLKRTLHRIE
eukprot:SAG11_NODE_2593_length_3187_cov_2.489637_2_plen_69_part_00